MNWSAASGPLEEGLDPGTDGAFSGLEPRPGTGGGAVLAEHDTDPDGGPTPAEPLVKAELILDLDPTVGLIDGTFRANLEETGMGYALEVEMIRAASELGLLTAPYIFDPESAEAMTRAGADVLVPHMGLTTKGTIGAETALTLDDGVERIQAMRDAAIAVNPDATVLCHGGPIAEPEDAGYVLERTTGVVGFFGASSMERLPTETAMVEKMKRFKALEPAD